MFMIQWTKRGHEIFYDLFPVAFKVFSSFSLNWEENAWSRVGGAGDYRWEWPRDVWVVEKIITSVLTDRTKARFTEKVLDVHGVDLSTTTLPKNSTRVTNLIYNKTRLANWSNIIHYIKKAVLIWWCEEPNFCTRLLETWGTGIFANFNLFFADIFENLRFHHFTEMKWQLAIFRSKF